MDALEYLRGLRHRWRLIAVIMLAALAAATVAGTFVSTPVSAYVASVQLIPASKDSSSSPKGGTTLGRQVASSSGTSNTSAALAASYAKSDAVNQKVAKALNYKGDLRKLARPVSVKVEKNGFLALQAKARTASKAVALANAYAQSLLEYLMEKQSQANSAAASALGVQISRINKRIAALDKRISKYQVSTPGAVSSKARVNRPPSAANSVSPADPLITERGAALAQLQTLSSEFETLDSQSPDPGFTQYKPAAAVAAPPTLLHRLGEFPNRFIIAAVISFLGAAALVLLLERFDPRIRTKDSAEKFFGLPVLVEVPFVRKSRHAHGTTLPTARNVRARDAFRMLAATLAPSPTSHAQGLNGEVAGRNPQTILVASAGPGEGTTTVVAELAATLAEDGRRRVVVLSCDFRSPRIHRLFNITAERGLADALRSNNGESVLNSHIYVTSMPGVFVVPSGSAVARPDELLASENLSSALAQARRGFDIVLLDTPPIMTSDITFLLPEIDAVLVVCRAGKAKPKLAARSTALLKQLHAPVIGVALNASNGVGLPKRYYRPEKWSRRALRVTWSMLRPVRWAGRLAWSLVRKGKALLRPLAPPARWIVKRFRPVAAMLSRATHWTLRVIARRGSKDVDGLLFDERFRREALPVNDRAGTKTINLDGSATHVPAESGEGPAYADPSDASKGFPPLSRHSESRY